MMKFRTYSLGFFLACALVSQSMEASFVIQNGRILDGNSVLTMPVEEHFNAGLRAIEAEQWVEAEKHFNIITANFPCTENGHEAFYYLGIAGYYLEELDFANEAFTEYLKGKQHPQYFIEAMQYKYNIAEFFRGGARRRFFGTKQLPKWADGKSLALEIYEEIIVALPCHELAVRALFSKGELQWAEGNYRESVEAFRMITKRFPKHELAPESYLMMMGVYMEQSRSEFQNPDILAFAHITLRKFKQDFPREERISDAEAILLGIKEVYARGLFETGAFYERICKPVAAAIYYQNAANLFPETQVALWCRAHLERLQQAGVDVVLPSRPVDEDTVSDYRDGGEDGGVGEDIDLDHFPLTDLDDEE